MIATSAKLQAGLTSRQLRHRRYLFGPSRCSCRPGRRRGRRADRIHETSIEPLKRRITMRSGDTTRPADAAPADARAVVRALFQPQRSRAVDRDYGSCTKRFKVKIDAATISLHPQVSSGCDCTSERCVSCRIVVSCVRERNLRSSKSACLPHKVEEVCCLSLRCEHRKQQDGGRDLDRHRSCWYCAPASTDDNLAEEIEREWQRKMLWSNVLPLIVLGVSEASRIRPGIVRCAAATAAPICRITVYESKSVDIRLLFSRPHKVKISSA